MKALGIAFLLALSSVEGFLAAGAPQDEDVVLRVLQDELARSTKRLKMEKSAPPYYVGYTVKESNTFEARATFGALASRGEGRSRTLSADVRAGDYSLDNTNFSDAGMGMGLFGGGGMGGNAAFSVDDDYDALRHTVWLATDGAYKRAVEQLEKKKAHLQVKTVKDRPDDFSKEEPVVSIRPPAKLELDRDRWTAITRKVSGLFREYPSVQSSMVLFMAQAENRWFVNSEGFRHRVGDTGIGMIVLASAQADDGMKVSDYEIYMGRAEKDLPSEEAIEKGARALAERLTSLARAPLAEEYRGPVLLEGQAASEFFAQTLAPSLGNAHEPVGQDNPMMAMMSNNGQGGNLLKEKVGKKVLPAFVSVLDDPGAREFGGVSLLGGYEIDEDGVKAQKVSLVEKGTLKTFCMARIPARAVARSNGHSKGGVGKVTNLFVSSDAPKKPEELRARILELAKEEDLKHVYVVRRISNLLSSVMNPASIMTMMMGRMSAGAEGVSLLPPVMLYRVSVADGKEELVRGATFGKMTLRALRDIDSLGDDARAYPVMLAGSQEVGGLVTPSVLLKEIELAKPGKETEKPPVLKNPFFEK
jgi:predicted Zn-dependent protease